MNCLIEKLERVHRHWQSGVYHWPDISTRERMFILTDNALKDVTIESTSTECSCSMLAVKNAQKGILIHNHPGHWITGVSEQDKKTAQFIDSLFPGCFIHCLIASESRDVILYDKDGAIRVFVSDVSCQSWPPNFRKAYYETIL